MTGEREIMVLRRFTYTRFQKKVCTLFSAIFHCALCLMSTYLVPKSRSEHVHYNRDFKL